jgi:hypothetical protein
VAVEYPDTRRARNTHVVPIDRAPTVVRRIKQAFAEARFEQNYREWTRPAEEIRARSDFEDLLIVSERPDTTREAVNRWYTNHCYSEGFWEPYDLERSPETLLSRGWAFNRRDSIEDNVDGRCWWVSHDVEYVRKVRACAERTGAKVFDWPSEAESVKAAVEMLNIQFEVVDAPHTPSN